MVVIVGVVVLVVVDVVSGRFGGDVPVVVVSVLVLLVVFMFLLLLSYVCLAVRLV